MSRSNTISRLTYSIGGWKSTATNRQIVMSTIKDIPADQRTYIRTSVRAYVRTLRTATHRQVVMNTIKDIAAGRLIFFMMTYARTCVRIYVRTSIRTYRRTYVHNARTYARTYVRKVRTPSTYVSTCSRACVRACVCMYVRLILVRTPHQNYQTLKLFPLSCFAVRNARKSYQILHLLCTTQRKFPELLKNAN